MSMLSKLPPAVCLGGGGAGADGGGGSRDSGPPPFLTRPSFANF